MLTTISSINFLKVSHESKKAIVKKGKSIKW